MTLAGRPGWDSYKQALARLADAGEALEGKSNLTDALQEFQAALRAYRAARDQLAGATA